MPTLKITNSFSISQSFWSGQNADTQKLKNTNAWTI